MRRPAMRLGPRTLVRVAAVRCTLGDEVVRWTLRWYARACSATAAQSPRHWPTGCAGQIRGGHVQLVPVAEATPDKVREVDLLVVGGPTHLLRMTSARTRGRGVQAAENPATAGSARYVLEPEAAGPGVREWLDDLPKALRGRRAAAFDTSLGHPLAGSATRSIARRLRRHGYEVVAKPKGFVVRDMQGPLRDGARGANRGSRPRQACARTRSCAG
jgi:hypothetical protein